MKEVVFAEQEYTMRPDRSVVVPLATARTNLRYTLMMIAAAAKAAVLAADLSPADIWAKVKRQLEQRINPSSFNTWLRPVQFVAAEEGRLRLAVPNEIFQYWLDEHYTIIILEMWHAQGGIAAAAIEWIVA